MKPWMQEVDRKAGQVIRQIASLAAQDDAAREKARTDPQIANPGRFILDTHEKVRATARALAAQGEEALGEYAAQHVLTARPTYAPTNTARALYVATIASTFQTLGPRQAETVVGDAVARGDYDVLSAVDSQLEAMVEHRKQFANDAHAHSALASLRVALANSPEMLASNEARDFLDELRGEIRSVAAIVSGDKASEALAVHVSVGSLKHLAAE